jgi:hypothetical protein
MAEADLAGLMRRLRKYMRRKRKLASISDSTLAGGLPIQLAVNWQLCPVFNAAALITKIGTFAKRRQLSVFGLKLPGA